MITLFSGTPGSGKSLHSIKKIIFALQHGRNVISNFPIKDNEVKKKKGKFYYKDNEELTINFLYDFARSNHVRGKEKQTLLVIDEAQTKFNPREFRAKDRLTWCQFFSQHRKLGYDVLLISQNDRLLDRQIRVNIEYETRHRKVNNFGTIGALFPVSAFACIDRWYGVNERLGSEIMFYKKKISDLYDSYAIFDNSIVGIDGDVKNVEFKEDKKEDKKVKKNKVQIKTIIKNIKLLIKNLIKGVKSK